MISISLYVNMVGEDYLVVHRRRKEVFMGFYRV